MDKTLIYIIFAVFILGVIYSFSKDIGLGLAVLSLMILLINRSGYFAQYLS